MIRVIIVIIDDQSDHHNCYQDDQSDNHYDNDDGQAMVQCFACREGQLVGNNSNDGNDVNDDINGDGDIYGNDDTGGNDDANYKCFDLQLTRSSFEAYLRESELMASLGQLLP